MIGDSRERVARELGKSWDRELGERVGREKGECGESVGKVWGDSEECGE